MFDADGFTSFLFILLVLSVLAVLGINAYEYLAGAPVAPAIPNP